MDAELRSFLEAMEQRTNAKMETMEQRAVARDAETRQALRDEIKAIEQRAVARDAETRRALEAKIDEARRQSGADRDAIIREIRALPEGLSTFQRQEADRLDAAREQAMLNQHVLPLKASAANHERRIKAVEGR